MHLWNIPREGFQPCLGSPGQGELSPTLIQVFHLPSHRVKASSLTPGHHRE